MKTSLNKTAKRLCLIGSLALVTLPTSGCANLVLWGLKDMFIFANFWATTPLIPVTPYFSQQIEDTYWEEERYKRVPILEPAEGENAPLICLDPPSPDEIMRAIPKNTEGGIPFFAETSWNNVRMVTELIVDRVDEPRFFPHVGPARLHHCHYKCTVFYTETKRSSWPIPFTHVDEREEVVYIDHDHLIRVAGPAGF